MDTGISGQAGLAGLVGEEELCEKPSSSKSEV